MMNPDPKTQLNELECTVKSLREDFRDKAKEKFFGERWYWSFKWKPSFVSGLVRFFLEPHDKALWEVTWHLFEVDQDAKRCFGEYHLRDVRLNQAGLELVYTPSLSPDDDECKLRDLIDQGILSIRSSEKEWDFILEMVEKKEREFRKYRGLTSALSRQEGKRQSNYKLVMIKSGVRAYPVCLPKDADGNLLTVYVADIEGTSAGKIAIRGCEATVTTAPVGPASGSCPEIVSGETYQAVAQNLIYVTNYGCGHCPRIYSPMDRLLEVVAGDVPEDMVYSHNSRAEEKLLYHTPEGFGLGCVAGYYVSYGSDFKPKTLYLFTRRALPVAAPKEVDGCSVIVVELWADHPLNRGLVPPQRFHPKNLGLDVDA